MIILAGSSNPSLAQELSQLAQAPLAQVDISKFPNGEKRIWVKSPLNGQTVVVLQSFSDPVDEHIIEFTLLVDAAKNLGAKSIVALIPWLGYSPQDKEFRKGEPISVQVIAKIIEAVGVDSIITVDIHSPASLDHFQVPVYQAHALPIFIDYLKTQDLHQHLVISVDKGSRQTCQQLAAALELPLCNFDKVRDPHTGAVSLSLVSGEVQGYHGIAIDDFVSTGSTRIQASRILKDLGLLSYTDLITHAILAGDSPNKLQASHIDKIIVTNTYPVPSNKRFPKLQVLSIAPQLAQLLSRLNSTT